VLCNGKKIRAEPETLYFCGAVCNKIKPLIWMGLVSVFAFFVCVADSSLSFSVFLWLLYWCVGWVLSCDYGKSKSVGLGQTKKEKKLSTCDAQTRKKAKAKANPKKTSLAELPAELKHITQRCKKKVTTIAEVTASEPAIFGETKKIYDDVSLSLSLAGLETKTVCVVQKRKGKRNYSERCWSKKEKKGKRRNKKRECPALFGSFFGWVVSLFLSSCLSLKAL